ncbi:hypothetical protein VTI74DRAFT_2677 [Chaetomium olivicolor]
MESESLPSCWRGGRYKIESVLFSSTTQPPSKQTQKIPTANTQRRKSASPSNSFSLAEQSPESPHRQPKPPHCTT